jgi:hypothetical protein
MFDTATTERWLLAGCISRVVTSAIRFVLIVFPCFVYIDNIREFIPYINKTKDTKYETNFITFLPLKWWVSRVGKHVFL